MKRNKEIFYIFVLQLLYIEAVFFYSLDLVDSNKSLCKPTIEYISDVIWGDENTNFTNNTINVNI